MGIHQARQIPVQMLAISVAALLSSSSTPSPRLPMQPSTYSRRPSHTLFGRGFFVSAAFIGNAGFDPLRLATAENLVSLRSAELKHGRLAMLAALGWPAQEYFHPFLDTTTFSPSVMSGGLEQRGLWAALAVGIATDMPVTERFELQQAEMINGRLAMLMLVAYALVEKQLDLPVVRLLLP